MRQFIAILAAFLLMPVLLKGIPAITKKKIGFGPVLLITGICLSLFAGFSLSSTAQSFLQVFTTVKNLEIIGAILLVGVLGNLLKQYGFLDRLVKALEVLIPNKKINIMVLPAVIGLLTVPGGAFLSAPFVDEIGKDLNLAPHRRVVVNLSFRHIAMFLLPFTTNMLFIPTVIPEINIYHLIGLNVAFVLIMQTSAYFMYLRGAKSPETKREGSKTQALKDLLFNLAPIYMVVLFNALFKLPMYLSVFLCIVLVFFLCGKDKSKFLPHAVKGISFSTLFMLIGVYFIQILVKNLDQVMSGVSYLFQNSSGLSVLLIISGASLLFGLTTGLSLVPLGIILPLVAALPMAAELKLVYTFFVFIWTFLGYYYSPLHLCQLLTVKYMGCANWPVYKEHLKVAPFLMIASYLLFYLYRWILVS